MSLANPVALYFNETAPAENVLVYDDQLGRRCATSHAVVEALTKAGFRVWYNTQLTTTLLLDVEKWRTQPGRRAVVLDGVTSTAGPLMRRLLMRNADVIVVIFSSNKNVRGDERLGRIWVARESRWVVRGPIKSGAEIMLDDSNCDTSISQTKTWWLSTWFSGKSVAT
jgi:hypothetical protein